MVTKSKTTTGKTSAQKAAAGPSATAQKATAKASTVKNRASAAAKITAVKIKSPVPVASSEPITASATKPAVKSTIQGVSQPEPTAMRKKQLIDAVVVRSGIKKKDAKPVIEAMLAVLGEAIAAGEDLNLPPFGKIKVTRQIDKDKAKVFVTRIRQSNAQPKISTPPSLAEVGK